MRSYYIPFFVAAGASLVSAQSLPGAFNISLDGLTNTSIVTITQLPASDPVTACQSNCSSPFQTIQSCIAGANDQSCFCTTSLQSSLADCEQCMFNFVFNANIKPASPLVGSNTALSGLAGTCAKLNVTLPKVALTLPPDWDGPAGIGLNLPATIVVVGTGFLLGLSALIIFSTIDIPE